MWGPLSGLLPLQLPTVTRQHPSLPPLPPVQSSEKFSLSPAAPVWMASPVPGSALLPFPKPREEILSDLFRFLHASRCQDCRSWPAGQEGHPRVFQAPLPTAQELFHTTKAPGVQRAKVAGCLLCPASGSAAWRGPGYSFHQTPG